MSEGPRFPADAFDDSVIKTVAGIVHDTWDPSGRILDAAASADTPDDPFHPRSYEDYASVLCGIAAAGGNHLDVMGYLRREEERFFGEPVTTGHERGSVAKQLWKAMGRRTKREIEEERQRLQRERRPIG